MLNVHWRKVVSAIVLSLMLLSVIACGQSSQPSPDIDATPTPPQWGLLTSLPVDVSAVLAADALLDKSMNQSSDQRSFRGFGMPKPGSPEELSPQWEFAVPPGTQHWLQ